MKTNHYLNKITSHLVTIVPMTPFTLKSTSKLRSFLHFRYSIVIQRFIPPANTAQLPFMKTVVITLSTTTTLFIETTYCAQ